ncbi:nitroreductase family protein [Mucilaginibacter sp. UR6-1]|uniref:nitroreductase family protein n=1 Tax=Mucilaginibacter sp. UR6-1 TaxID=1435643 RepID=UPI001E33928C|nr:nitroreductase family protein [Mucilaginibacter sp. UR6-1]MCC8409049.1 nitroreductase family protein [Mucilaginibacter sp. UR6-1]
MDNNTFSTISTVIKTRRTIKPGTMNGQKIPNGHIAAILELADWAPTHAFTEPWRFVIYEDPTVFCKQHAELYKTHTPAENFKEATYTNLQNIGNNASHVVIAVMKRGSNPNIPALEEVAAASAAVQNILLAATSLNIGSFWSTGGMTLKPAMKNFLELAEEDAVLGLLYLGYTDNQPEGRRVTPLEEKVKWVK